MGYSCEYDIVVYHIYRKLISNLLHLTFCLIFFFVTVLQKNPLCFSGFCFVLMGLMTSMVKNMWHHDMKEFVCRDYILAIAADKWMRRQYRGKQGLCHA